MFVQHVDGIRRVVGFPGEVGEYAADVVIGSAHGHPLDHVPGCGVVQRFFGPRRWILSVVCHTGIPRHRIDYGRPYRAAAPV